LDKDKLVLIDYSGTIHYDTIGELIHDFKNQVHSLGIHVGTYKKVLLVMIETLENIMKYGQGPFIPNTDNIDFKPRFSLIKEGGRFLISSANLLLKKDIPGLSGRLNYLNTLTPQGIKDYYKEVITNGEFSQYGGAGLGLIEMAKISGNQMDHRFSDLNDFYSRFDLRIIVDEFPVMPV
jgi:hypothetical protein